MTRLIGIGALGGTALALCAAKGDEPALGLAFFGVVIAVLVALALPAALLLHGLRPDWIAAQARTYDRRRTACVVVGAGLVLGAIVVVAAVASRNGPLAALISVPMSAWFLVGFSGCARRQGERLTETTDGVKPLVVGWLARAGAFAVPVLWPFVGTYLVAAAVGVPLVAIFDRSRSPAE